MMGAASSGGATCGKCGLVRRKWQQMKGGAPICKECFTDTMDAENAQLRREIHGLKTTLARMRRKGFVEDVPFTKRVVTPPEQRWDGYFAIDPPM